MVNFGQDIIFIFPLFFTNLEMPIDETANEDDEKKPVSLQYSIECDNMGI